jgi:hypothetical protein
MMQKRPNSAQPMNAAVDPCGRSRCLLGDRRPVRPLRRSGDVERAEHRRLRRAGWERIGERVDEHRKAEGVRPEDELLAPVVRDVARLGEDPDALLPLALGQADLGGEGVKVAREALHEGAQPLVLGAFEARDHRRGDVGRGGAPAAHTGGSGSYWM